MRILFFCPQPLWPPNTGARLRNFYLAEALAQNFSLTVLQLIAPGDAVDEETLGETFEHVVSLPRERGYTAGKILKGLIGPLPVSILNYSSPVIAKEVAELLREESFDAVQLESVHLLKYLEVIRTAPRKPKVVADWHNIESQLMWRYAERTHFPTRLAARRTAKLLENAEQRLLADADVHTVVSERERDELLKHDRKADVHVIHNGVDTTYFLPNNEIGGNDSLLFVGSMDYHANIDAVTWFVSDVWPVIAARDPDLQFTIAGRSPSAAVQALASDRVRVTGTVDDIRKIYEGAFAVVVPLRVGGGTRLKILEAMAAGVPVISTRLGAEGLNVKDNVHLLLADRREDIAASVAKLRLDSELRAKLAAEARKLVTEQYDWGAVGQRLVGIYANMSEGRGGA